MTAGEPSGQFSKLEITVTSVNTPPQLKAALHHRRITVHRFVRAANSEAAARTGARGIILATGTLADPPAVIEHIATARPRVAPYTHTGTQGLWWVSTDVDALLCAVGTCAATEAAHQLVTIDEDETQDDAFEFEIQVLSSADYERMVA